MLINLIADDIVPGVIKLPRPRGLPRRDTVLMYFLRKDNLLSNAIIFTQFDLIYADDQILMATSEDDLQIMAHHLNLIARKYKMTISSTKTKSMAIVGEPHTKGKNYDKRQYY